MLSEESRVEVPKLNVPAELRAEAAHRNKRPTDLRVDGWKPSLLERLKRMLGLA